VLNYARYGETIPAKPHSAQSEKTAATAARIMKTTVQKTTLRPPAGTGGKLSKPGIWTFGNLPDDLATYGWHKITDVHESAKHAAACLPDALAFKITDNLGAFMRRYWLLCRLTCAGADNDVYFVDKDENLHKLNINNACAGLDDDKTDELNKPNEHALFQAAMNGDKLFIPATFGRTIPAVVSKGGDAVHSTQKFANHTVGAMSSCDPLWVRLAKPSEDWGMDIYTPHSIDWK
jgi:hypothetical protein